MNRVAFTIFGIPIMWYGVLISIGMVLGILLACREAKRVGEDPENIVDLMLWCIPAAVIGARAYYVIFEWGYYSQHLSEIFNIRQGGLAIHGGLIAAILVGWLVGRKKKLNFGKYIDIVAPSIILGQAIGRWGNFINGEAHGGPTSLPWGILVDGVRVHPTFLYESLWDIGVFVLLMYSRKHKHFEGEVFLQYGILYSLGRFWIEGLRTDSLMFFGFRQAQLLSLAVIVVFGVIYILKMRKWKQEQKGIKIQ